MIDLSISLPDERAGRILCIGAHCDDIEIGCGGTMLMLAQHHPDLEFAWVVFTGSQSRLQESQNSAESFFESGITVELITESYPDGRLPHYGADVKDSMEQIAKTLVPDVIFTHWRGDAHQDHRFLSDVTKQTFRDSLILEYEIPKYDGDIGNPNLYVPLDENLVELKISNLFAAYPSQSSRDWFDDRLFRALMRLRGMECRSRSGYAEAFFANKVCVTP